MIFILPLLFHSLLSITAYAATPSYQCTTEFGESVPLGLEVRVNDVVDQAQSRKWNQSVIDDPKEKARVKRVELPWPSGKAVFEWIYVKRRGADFRMNSVLKGEHSEWVFADGSSKLIIQADLSDRRAGVAGGHAEMNLGYREHGNLRVRVFKKVPAELAARTVSASGEHALLRADRFILDVGTDEYLPLPSVEHRFAALEIKVDCTPE